MVARKEDSLFNEHKIQVDRRTEFQILWYSDGAIIYNNTHIQLMARHCP